MKSELSAPDKLAAQIVRAREQPSFTAMLDLVRAIDACITGSVLKKRAPVRDDELARIRHKLLQEAFDICFSQPSHNPRRAAQALRAGMQKDRTVRGQRTARGPISGAVSADAAESVPSEWIATYHLAVAIMLRQSQNANESQQVLQALIACLDVSYDDLGRMFSVSGETVRRWEKGSHPIPSGRKAEITLAGTALDRLLKMFRLERLPETIRRPADLFEGKPALNWILQGRIAEVADRYEVLLRYQA